MAGWRSSDINTVPMQTGSEPGCARRDDGMISCGALECGAAAIHVVIASRLVEGLQRDVLYKAHPRHRSTTSGTTNKPTYSQPRLVRACSFVVSISVVCRRPRAVACVHRQRARAGLRLSGTYRDGRFVSNSKWQLEVIAEWLIKPVGSWEHLPLQRHCLILIHCSPTNGG
jgi:hypothetical protein